MTCARPIAFAVLILVPPALAADEATPAADFRREVAPILVRKCLGCHNDKKADGGLNMQTLALLKKGGKTMPGEAITPGDPDASYLLDLIRPDAEPRMPFKLPPLSDAEAQTLARWVRNGATPGEGVTDDTPLASLVDPLRDLPAVALKAPTSDPVAALVFSPDGATLAAGHGRTVHLFDARNAQEIAHLDDHPGPVTALRFTPDGRSLIAVGGRPGQFGSVIVWDLATKSKRHDLRAHTDAVLTAALAPDGRTLATGSYDRLIRLWDVIEGTPRSELKEHTDAVHGLAFSPDGARLASASADRTLKVWDVASGRRLVTLSDATAEQYAARFAPDGTILGAGADRTIRAWRFAGDTAELVRSVIAHDGPILRLIVAPDGRTLVSCGEDRAVKLWDLATFAPRAAFPPQSDWPLDLAASPDGARLAIGRYDGSLDLLDPAGTLISRLLASPAPQPEPAPAVAAKPEAKEPAKPELVRPASLNPPSPRGATRGTSLQVTLTGNGVGRADTVLFTEPGLTATILPAEKPDPNRLNLDLTIAPDARIGLHSFLVRTPLGTPPAQKFAVAAAPETALNEPDNDNTQANPLTLPATILGTIDQPGDLDHAIFEAKSGQTLVFETLARPLGSSLDGTLTLLAPDGRILATAEDNDNTPDPLLIARIPADGRYTLRIADAEYGGSPNHFYRIAAGPFPRIANAFPLGVERGRAAEVRLEGVNLEGDSATITVEAPSDAPPGTLRAVTYTAPDGTRSLNSRLVVTADGPQSTEAEPNDDPAHASPVATPGGVSARIGHPGDADHFRFEAKKGQRLILEVFGRRLGTAIDPAIEILDAAGNPVPRAVLRPVSETFLTFRDHTSAQPTFRLTVWNDLAIGDHVLLGRELLRVAELPRNADDELLVEALGPGRLGAGERLGALETSPEHHPSGQPMYKVEIHPPGATFPPGGPAPVTLSYRNDDAGPGFNKDARLTFDPPADGPYLLRVEDPRGLGGPDSGYHLVFREPRPDFVPSLATDNPSVPRGGTVVLTANIRRLDGFYDPVEITLTGLPPGLTASPTRIEPHTHAADLVLSADASAPDVSPPTWTLTARSVPADPSTPPLEHTLAPGGPTSGWITVTPPPNLKVHAPTDRVALRPGDRVELTFGVERSPAFTGRVPIDVRNLPSGVHVENIGLNGVLVTEQQTERTISLYAAPWVRPQERPFFAVGKCEPAGTEHSSAPILLVIEP